MHVHGNAGPVCDAHHDSKPRSKCSVRDVAALSCVQIVAVVSHQAAQLVAVPAAFFNGIAAARTRDHALLQPVADERGVVREEVV